MREEHKEFEEEYRHIKSDVKKVIITNLIFLALLVALYFINQKTGIIEKIF